MPKGIPKSEGERIGDKFDAEYRKMKRKSKGDRAARKCEKESRKKKKGGCSCGK